MGYVRGPTHVSVIQVGLAQTVRFQFVHKHVAMVVTVQIQMNAHAPLNGWVMIVVLLIVSRRA